MSPTPEGTARALKAWETIGCRRGEDPKVETGAGTRKRWKTSDNPDDWKQIRVDVWKRAMTTRRRVRCECLGECGKHKSIVKKSV
jgi:hypothetical protein